MIGADDDDVDDMYKQRAGDRTTRLTVVPKRSDTSMQKHTQWTSL